MESFNKSLVGLFLFCLFAVIINLAVLAVAVWLVVYILRAMGVIA